MAEDSTIYSLKVSSAIMEQCDQVAEVLGKDPEQFPSGSCKRADVVRLCLNLGLKKLAKENAIILK